MIYIEKEVDITPAWQKYFKHYYSPDGKIAFWDIESTGLSANHNRFVLGGILCYNEKTFILKQFFSENKDDEKETLLHYFNELSKYNTLVSYNGINFDQVFLNKRFNHKLLPVILGNTGNSMPGKHDFFHLDIFHILRTCSNLNKILPNLKQKTIEQYCDIATERDDLISGKESVELYATYLKSKDKSVLDQILLHNSDDCKQLAMLPKIFYKIDIHQAAFSKGFVVMYDNRFAFIENIRFKSDKIEISGRLKNIPHSQIFFGDYYNFNYDKEKNSFLLSILYEKISNLYNVIDLEKLPIENNQLKKLPCCKNDYLLLSNNDKINYMECNMLAKEFLLYWLKESRYLNENIQ